MDENKLDRFLSQAKTAQLEEEARKQKYDEARGRRGGELQLWHQWNEGGRKQEHLEPLLTSLQPLIKRETTRRLTGLGGSIPRAALESELQQAAVKALETYDPTKLGPTGRTSQLTSHIHNNFQRVTDFIARGRNASYLPRNKLERAGEFNAAKEEFHQQYGRLPTLTEIHGLLPKWKKREVVELSKALAQEVHTNVGGGLKEDEPAGVDQYRAAVILVYGSLSPQEKEFADLHYPEEGKTPLSIRQIAKKLAVPEHRVYRLRARVDKRIAPLVRGS